MDSLDLVDGPTEVLLALIKGILPGFEQPFQLFKPAPEQIDLLGQEMDVVDEMHDLAAHLGHVGLDLFLLRGTLGLEERIFEVLQLGLPVFYRPDDLKGLVFIELFVDIDDVVDIHHVLQPDLIIIQRQADLDDLFDRDR